MCHWERSWEGVQVGLMIQSVDLPQLWTSRSSEVRLRRFLFRIEKLRAPGSGCTFSLPGMNAWVDCQECYRIGRRLRQPFHPQMQLRTSVFPTWFCICFPYLGTGGYPLFTQKYSAFIICMTSRPGFKEFPFPADCTDCSIH